jgi:hypothetical protein
MILDGEVALDAPQFISAGEGKDSCGKGLGATAAKLQLDEAQATTHNLKITAKEYLFLLRLYEGLLLALASH